VTVPDDRGRQDAEPETRFPPARSLAQLESSQAAMRETTKWLIAATAAVAAALVAGLQLKDLPHGFWATTVALLGVATALVAVVFILRRATGVLSAGYTTFGSILDLNDEKSYKAGQEKALKLGKRIGDLEERKKRHEAKRLAKKAAKTGKPQEGPATKASNELSKTAPQGPSNDASPEASPETLQKLTKEAWYTRLSDWLWRRLFLPVLWPFSRIVKPVMKWAQERALLDARDEGVRIRDLINYLNSDSFYFTQGLAGTIYELNDKLRKADRNVIRFREELASGRPPSGDPAHASDRHASAQAQLTEAEWRQNRLESAMNVLIIFANQMLLEQRFRKLISAISFGGAVVTLGVGAFVVAPKLGNPQPLLITQPTQVTIRVLKGLGQSCTPGTLLQGVAVGGTWDEPIVVTQGKDGCPAQEMTLNKGQAVAVPVVEPSPSASATPTP
jgi:hypothetical protein